MSGVLCLRQPWGNAGEPKRCFLESAAREEIDGNIWQSSATRNAGKYEIY